MADDIISQAHDKDSALWDAIDELRNNQMSLQEEINTVVAELGKVASDIAIVQATLQTEINNLASQNPGVDLSGLRTAVQPLDAAVQALGKLEPAPAPTPAPEPAPVLAPAAEPAPEQPVAEGPPIV
jgi:hypothetical protein